MLNGDRVTELDLATTGGQLKLTIAEGAKITGTVSGRDGLITHKQGEVMLVLVGKKLRKDAKDVKNSEVDGKGTYSIAAVPPGRYHLLAFDILESVDFFMQEDDMQAAVERAEVFEVTGAGEIVRNVKVTGKPAK